MEGNRFIAGAAAKSDCLVAYERGDAPMSVVVRSSVGALFGKAIGATVLRVASEFGVSSGLIKVDDDGALDGTLAARVEAALRKAGFVRLPSTASATPLRAASSRGRFRRARLYLPGDQPHLAANAGLFGTDCLIFDLEDAVVAERKFDTRILVRRTLEESLMLGDREIVVRINPLSSPYGRDDLSEIVRARPHAITLPKCESAADVTEADEAISALEKAAGIKQGSIFLMPIIETAAGVLSSREIAQASPRNVALCFGREDFSRDIGAVAPPAGGGAFPAKGIESLLARQMIILAARASGIAPLDSVFADVEDEEGLFLSCLDARALGFAGKGVLHPLQIPIVMKAFRPTEVEASRAEKIVAAFDGAAAEGRGAISVDGQMVDAPVAEKARALLRDYREEH
jgi:citrate lyase subunit beta/citryl-CoA lyase